MIHKIELFLFILSVFYNTTLVFKMVRNVLRTQPQPLNLEWKDMLLWGVSLSYIITYILT